MHLTFLLNFVSLNYLISKSYDKELNLICASIYSFLLLHGDISPTSPFPFLGPMQGILQAEAKYLLQILRELFLKIIFMLGGESLHHEETCMFQEKLQDIHTSAGEQPGVSRSIIS